MEHSIIELLSNKMSSNLSLIEIANKLKTDTESIRESIRFLEEDGTVYMDRNNRYCLVSSTSMKKGTIKVTKRKGAIVVFDNGNELDLLPNSHKKVNHNDTVLVEPYYKGGNAQLVKVLKREYKDYVGEVVRCDDKYFLMFKDERERVYLREKLPEGTRVLLDGKTGDIKCVIGHKDDPDERVKELLVENNFEVGFSDEYRRELEYIPDSLSDEVILREKRNGRLDIRKVNIVTIDGSDTKDFDDAVCFWNDMFTIAIADTTSTILEGSVIDKTTIKRGISVYPPGMVEPMIDHKISNGICSLNPYEDRLAVGSISKFNDGEISFCKMGPMIINSKKRMTYEDVNLYLEHGIVIDGYEKYTGMLENLYHFAMKQKKKMLNEGFLQFSSTEVKMAFEDNKTIGIKTRHQGKAEELIEFSMLYHNILMTNYFIKHNLPFIARNHEEANNEKVSNWGKLLKERGYEVELKKKYNNDDIKKILEAYKDAEEKVILDNIGIRSQSKAKYGAFNKGHFALGLKAYATFTSPIRRLSDYTNQRIYIDSIKYGDKYARDKWEPRMEALAKIATDSEFRADKVEREAVRLKTAEYVANYYHKGDKFTGYIAGIEEGYMRVLLSSGIAYGKVYFNTKEWILGKDGYSIINKNNGEKILVGDTMDLVLRNVDLDGGNIIFARGKGKECSYEEEKKGKSKVKTR